MKLVEEYNAVDELSMEDNNTSAFNYRLVENSVNLSWHCFGLAVDINPLYNPYFPPFLDLHPILDTTKIKKYCSV